MKDAEKAAFYRELAKLTAASFHLDRSVALLLGQKPSPARRQYLEGLQRGLAAGHSVAVSVAEENAALVSGLETSLIDAGERSGTLAAAFSHLAHYFAATDSAARQARSAVTYPLILVHLAIVLPELPAAVMPEGPNPVAKIAISLGLLWVVLLAGSWLWRWLSHRAEVSADIDRSLRRLPFIGAVRKHWAMARFTQVFHAGLLAALRISDLLRLAGNASQSGLFLQGSEVAAQSVEEGQTIAQSLTEANTFPTEFVHAVAIAEEVGSLDTEVARWAVIETEMASEAIARASLWLPKIGYGFVVIFVVYRIYQMLEGYYGGMLKQIEAL